MLPSQPPASSGLLRAALLATAGGYLDGFTYFGHGHVFANAMTGNIVVLGADLISREWAAGFLRVPPLLAFIAGVLTARILEQPGRRWRPFAHRIALATQVLTLALLGALPAHTPDLWITTPIAFASSIQVESFRRVHGRAYNSTFTTGNLRSFAEYAFDWLTAGRSAQQLEAARDFGAIVLTFFVGATLGSLAVRHLGNYALWLDLLPLLLAAPYTLPPGTNSRPNFDPLHP